MSIESLLTSKVIEAVSQCYGVEPSDVHVQLQPTRKEFAGDLTKRSSRNSRNYLSEKICKPRENMTNHWIMS